MNEVNHNALSDRQLLTNWTREGVFTLLPVRSNDENTLWKALLLFNGTDIPVEYFRRGNRDQIEVFVRFEYPNVHYTSPDAFEDARIQDVLDVTIENIIMSESDFILSHEDIIEFIDQSKRNNNAVRTPPNVDDDPWLSN